MREPTYTAHMTRTADQKMQDLQATLRLRERRAAVKAADDRRIATARAWHRAMVAIANRNAGR